MTLQEIRKGIIKLLREGTEVKYITGEEVLQSKDDGGTLDGQELQLPVIIVQLLPASVAISGGGYHRDKQVTVDISYLTERYTSNTEIYQMWEQLNQIMLPAVRIGDRAITPVSVNTRITDGIGHYILQLAFADQVEFTVPEPPAKELKLIMDHQERR